MSKGKLFVISGASGVGKGTVLKAIMEQRKDLVFSVSATTRPPRDGEVDGVHYYFKTVEEYQEMIAKGEFLEPAAVYNNYYGTQDTTTTTVVTTSTEIPSYCPLIFEFYIEPQQEK